MTHVPTAKKRAARQFPFLPGNLFGNYSVLLLTFGILLAGCSKKTPLERSLIGRWENVGQHVTVHTYNNNDTTLVIDLTEDDLRTRFDTKPYVTILHEDGTYILEIRSKTDSLIERPAGEWMVEADSLIMRQLKPALGTYVYKIKINGSEGEFRTMIDYDNDGQADDEMISVSRKIGDE